MGIIDRLKGMDTGTLVGLAVGVALIGLVVLIGLLVVLAAVIGTFVLGVGESVETGESDGNPLQAGVSVQPDVGADEVEVVWTSNMNADALVVAWDATDGDVRPTETAGETSDEDGAVRLSEVGSSVTLSATDAGGETDVNVHVTAVGDEHRRVIYDRTVGI